MTRLVSHGISQEKARQAIDLLLEDKSDEFRAVVFELCRQMGWPDDEPSFLFAIMTNQLQALVEQYPERISVAMAQAARQLEQDWQKMQAALSLAAIQNHQMLEKMAQQLANAKLTMHQELSGTQQLLEDQRSDMLQVLEQSQSKIVRLMTDERAAIAQQAQDLAEQQKQVLEAHTKNLIAQAVKANQERADKQVKQIISSARAAHFWQSFGFACCAAVVLVGWALVLEGQADRLSDWGRFKSWNQDQLQACRAVDSATCNIHIKPPN